MGSWLLGGGSSQEPRANSPEPLTSRRLLAHGHLKMCGETREATFPATRQRLDYIFCDEMWELVDSEVVRRGSSDHWPIIGHFKLKQ